MGLKSRLKKGSLRDLSAQMRRYALALPGAHEDFPWGESVAKVRGKVFAFFGRSAELDDKLGVSVKLSISGEGVLAMPFAQPTGYGLGRAGWVSITCTVEDNVPAEMLFEWIEESYRAIAPKKLLDELDARGR